MSHQNKFELFIISIKTTKIKSIKKSNQSKNQINIKQSYKDS